jgi:hypothetical protein
MAVLVLVCVGATVRVAVAVVVPVTVAVLVLVCVGVTVRVAVAVVVPVTVAVLVLVPAPGRLASRMSGKNMGGNKVDRVAKALLKPASKKVASVIKRTMEKSIRFLRDRFGLDICCSLAIRVRKDL